MLRRDARSYHRATRLAHGSHLLFKKRSNQSKRDNIHDLHSLPAVVVRRHCRHTLPHFFTRAGSTSAKTFTTLTCATRTRNEQFLILPSTDWSTTEEPRTDERHSLGLGVQLLTVWDVKALAQILVPLPVSALQQPHYGI